MTPVPVARPNNSPPILSDADALVVRSATKVTAPIIAAAPHLRVIARAGTGVDNVDVPAASARGIVVMNAPGANSVSVAELAVGSDACAGAPCARRRRRNEAGQVGEKEVPRRRAARKDAGPRRDSAGSARRSARRAAAFGMRIIAHDPFIAEQVAADLGVELVSLDDLFARADYVSLHMPSNEKTRHLVNAERLSRAKKGIRLVNTARGDLIDEQALADAIEVGPGRRRRRSTCSNQNRPQTSGSRSCHRSSPRRISPPRHARDRNSSASKPPRRCVTSSRTASSETQ